MSDTTPSTLTSPLSSLFSESFSPGGQSGSEIVTSDEEPDLGAFTTILRAWGYLQPQPRIPLQFSSLTSSSTRWTTPTTITGYPGFGDANSEPVEGSTIWDHFPINSYLRASNANSTATSSGRTERARPLLLEEPEDDDYVSSPPPSPVSESEQTVEITSEADATSLRSGTDDDGEGMLEPRATPSNEGRTVLVAGSQGEQMSPPAAPPASSPPHLSVMISDNSVSSSSVSYQILDDNTPIFRSRPTPSTLSLDSYRPQISTLRTPSSVFQETPSPAFQSIVPIQETPTSSSPAVLPGQRRPFTGRMISNSSHAESDIINSYYNRETMAVASPSSTDQPARDFLWPRLEIPAQPRTSPTEPTRVEISDHAHHRQTRSVIDDNSSASAVTEEPPPSSNTMSSALFTQQEIATPRSDSPGTLSSHSMTPSHSMIFPGAPASALSPTTTTTTTTTTSRSAATANSIHPSMESPMVYSTQYPPFPSGHRDQQPRSDFLDDTQATPSRQHHHLLSVEGEPCHGQPSLGFLDAALEFMAAERARLNALIEHESHRSPNLSFREAERDEMVGHRENEKKYAIGDYFPFL
ncbi:hypothetical protein AGABI1DRAFT_130274 [Agaricus bisporus var. burnettii JB137-S8]|uniref:Uncharacterized protein n=1 Tax=Agaricus bisporus var. burnettii (strain JB137-S8 / ATCC MYA-4627 / FGSC 10392) TaxID=597362 RepID=K5X376_AGABU|nr:uncharacterized protein AGABI1DRAFT_130274 [Agaricus bisporus var. burnettii JB137-S8]EKM77583.1 hypothetical protein AGABI1DRAFT_130274 [Agaricus bisporus var. burnettii JB137-S8]